MRRYQLWFCLHSVCFEQLPSTWWRHEKHHIPGPLWRNPSMDSLLKGPIRLDFDIFFYVRFVLHWHHNEHDGVSNHQPHGCLLNRLFRRRSKTTSKVRVTCLCVGNSPGPVNSPHKGPVTRKMFPFDDVIMGKILNEQFMAIRVSKL